MKTLTIALVAASIAATPLAAFAQAATAAKDAAATATATLAPANNTAESKKWKVGDRLPGTYLATSKYKADASLGLPAAPYAHRWLHVGDNAYLINDRTATIVQITGVAAKS